MEDYQLKKIRIMAAIAALLTCISVFLLLNSNIGKEEAKEKVADNIEVVVAAENISAETQIKIEMLKTINVPKNLALPSAIKKKEEIAGMITKTDIVAGEIILSEKFYNPENVEAGLAFVIKNDMRAITVSVDNSSGLSGLLRQGNFVDIVACVRDAKLNTEYTEFLLQKIKVLALNNLTSGTLGGDSALYETVTLEVSPEDALKLSMIDFKKRYPDEIIVDFRMILRSQKDEKVLETLKINLVDVIK